MVKVLNETYYIYVFPYFFPSAILIQFSCDVINVSSAILVYKQVIRWCKQTSYLSEYADIIMPACCAIVNCSNRHRRDNKSFFILPKVIEHQGDKLRELSKERRDKWLANISRGDIKPSSQDNITVCSDHFIEGNYDLKTRTFYIFIFK